MRIDRARLDAGSFPYSFELQTRFSDLDKIGHINNVALTAILQEGRNRFIRASGLYDLAQCQLVVLSLNIEFASDLMHPEPIDMGIGILEIGRTSFRFGQIARQNGRVGAYAEVVQVARDASGPLPLPEAWRERLEGLRISAPG